jgi:hypothetical protein
VSRAAVDQIKDHFHPSGEAKRRRDFHEADVEFETMGDVQKKSFKQADTPQVHRGSSHAAGHPVFVDSYTLSPYIPRP